MVRVEALSDAEAERDGEVMQRERDLERRIAELESENRRLREALEGLLDVQNDAPLGIREEEWKQAVERARAALSSEAKE